MNSIGRSISIVIGSYNHGRYIKETIESALAQTRVADELIVVDDGSQDNSLDQIEPFRDRVRIITKDNGGQASALNAGFAASHGDIILFLDSDDRLLPDCLETVEQAWIEDYAKIHFRLRLIDGEGRANGETRPAGHLPAGDLVSVVLRQGGYTTSPTTGNAFSRKCLAKIMPLPEDDWRTYADCPIMFLAPFFGPIGAINEVLGEYRVHANNASGIVRDGQIQLKSVQGELVRDLRQDAAVKGFCDQNGYIFQSGTVLRNWYSIKLRLISLRLDPHAHPVSGERRTVLLMEALRSLWINSGLGLKKKLLFSGWSLAMAGGPRWFARRAAPFAYTRANSGGYSTVTVSNS